MDTASIYLVDTDADSRAARVADLRSLGYRVSHFPDLPSARTGLKDGAPDLMLIDRNLPNGGGFELLNEIKREGNPLTRVVMLASGHDAEDVAAALDAGADDCVAKPYAKCELRARLEACLRRAPATSMEPRITVGNIMIDQPGQRVVVDGQTVTVAPREYRLLHFLVCNQDRVFTRQQLLASVWGRSGSIGVRTVDVHVRRLRQLLEPFGYERFLQTVRGSGYRFSADV